MSLAVMKADIPLTKLHGREQRVIWSFVSSPFGHLQVLVSQGHSRIRTLDCFLQHKFRKLFFFFMPNKATPMHTMTFPSPLRKNRSLGSGPSLSNFEPFSEHVVCGNCQGQLFLLATVGLVPLAIASGANSFMEFCSSWHISLQSREHLNCGAGWHSLLNSLAKHLTRPHYNTDISENLEISAFWSCCLAPYTLPV